MKRILVIGIGRFGRAVIETLSESRNVEVIAVDEKMEAIEEVRDQVSIAAKVDSIECEALEALGVREVDVAVVSIGEDFEAAVLTVAVLKELGVKEIVARAQTDRRRRVLEAAGATRVVMVEAEMGRRVAHALVDNKIIDHAEVGQDVSLIHWAADGRVVGKSLRDLNLRGKWELTLVAVKHGRSGQKGKVTVAPPSTYVFQPDDVLLLCGRNARLGGFTA